MSQTAMKWEGHVAFALSVLSVLTSFHSPVCHVFMHQITYESCMMVRFHICIPYEK